MFFFGGLQEHRFAHPQLRATHQEAAGERPGPTDFTVFLLAFFRGGREVFALDYRGFGQSEGTPSEEGLIEDALSAWRWLKKESEAGRRRLKGTHLPEMSCIYIKSK